MLTVLGYFEPPPPLRSWPERGLSSRNLARASEIAEREISRCYFSQKLHVLLVIIYANHMHKLCFYASDPVA